MKMIRSQPPFRLRQNAAQKRKDSSKKTTKPQVERKITRPILEPLDNGLMFPGVDTAFKALMSARLSAAIWSHITDCDETYNYWEPMHYILFGKGLQTWEYSPEFALRSYTYLLFHALPSFLYQKLFYPSPLILFYFTRCILAVVSSLAEVYFYRAVCREFGIHIARICLAFQLFSSGMFISSTALLPSSFAMYTFAGACGAWWHQKYALAIFFTALGSLLGWPFAALLGVPIAFDMLIREKMYCNFVIYSIICGSTILIPMAIIDSFYYGKLVIAPLNLIQYNVFTSHGPNLYGIEPFSYYFVNAFLNFNFIWVMALVCPLLIICAYFFIPTKKRTTLALPHWLSLSPLYLWLAVFCLQAHKEERFLFPIYPMICLSGAISVDIIQKFCFRIWSAIKTVPKGSHYLDFTVHIMAIFVVITSVLGLSRIVSLYSNYHAPLDLVMELRNYPFDTNTTEKIGTDRPLYLCVGKDWYYFPSSFFLPNDQWNVRFVQSEFNGILPSPYANSENATIIVHKYFNDENRAEPEMYFNIDKCDFMLDFDNGKQSVLEPIYAKLKNRWKIIKTCPFLISSLSNKFFRAFYVPYFTDQYVAYGQFTLLQVKKFKVN